MINSLTVTTAASDKKLLTVEQMRAAAGVTGSGEDAALTALEARVAACIMAECNIAVGSGAIPTLRRETLTEVFYQVRAAQLILSRRHEVSVTSIVVDGTSLDATEWLVEPESGFVYRLSDDAPAGWCFTKATVVYEAGFDTVPGDLVQAASDALRILYLEGGRDPLVRRERVDIPGLESRETDYWVGAIPGQSSDGPLPAVVSGQLQRFKNYRV